MSDLIDKVDVIAILEEELQTVKWLADRACTAKRKAAAALRLVELENEIKKVKSAA